MLVPSTYLASPCIFISYIIFSSIDFYSLKSSLIFLVAITDQGAGLPPHTIVIRSELTCRDFYIFTAPQLIWLILKLKKCIRYKLPILGTKFHDDQINGSEDIYLSIVEAHTHIHTYIHTSTNLFF